MKKQQIIVLASIAAAAVALCYLSWLFLFSPLNKKVRDLTAQMDSAKITLEEAKNKKAQYEKFLAESENVRQGLLFVDSRLDPRTSFDEQQRILRMVAASTEYYSYEESIAPALKVSKDVSNMYESTATIKLQASYHALGKYLTSLVSQKRVINVTSMKLTSIDPGTEQSDPATVAAELTVCFYFNPPSGGK